MIQTLSTTHWTGFITTTGGSVTSTGYGTVISSRTFNILGYAIRIRNTYTLLQGARYVTTITETTNLGAMILYNLRIWAGARVSLTPDAKGCLVLCSTVVRWAVC